MITAEQIQEANADRLICKANLAAWRKRLKKAVALYPSLHPDAWPEAARLIGEAYLQVKACGACARAAQEVYRQTIFMARKLNHSN